MITHCECCGKLIEGENVCTECMTEINESTPKEYRLRKVESSGTWYDYKMAFLGTLMDYDLTMRVDGNSVFVYRSSEMFAKSKTTTYVLPKKTWKYLYYQDLIRVLRGMKADA